MATVFIPPLLRELTGGQNKVSVPGESVRAVIAELDLRFPGIAGRLCAEGRIRPGMSVVVDGALSTNRHAPVGVTSEVFLLQRIKGG